MNWEQIATWLVLLSVLYALISGSVRFDGAAFGGLLVLGLIGIAPPSTLFSGFSSPTLFTVSIVLVMSAGIVESGILIGFGQEIAKRVTQPKKQMVVLMLFTTVIGGFVNNVGTVGIMLPTTERMARRADVPVTNAGMWLAHITILSGSYTLIGTASNLIVSSFRYQALGEPFKMFVFAAHGLAMVGVGFLTMLFCEACGLKFAQPTGTVTNNSISQKEAARTEPPPERSRRKSTILLLTLTPVIILTSFGIVHPSVGFGVVVLSWLITGVLSATTAYKNINIPIILFLGSMLSIANILRDSGALEVVAGSLLPLVVYLPPYFLILSVLFITAAVSNLVDNSVSAILMSPMILQLYQTGSVAVSADALLMAIAAGASLGIVIPTHQATLVVMNSTGFSKKSFMKTGAFMFLLSSVSASFVIYMVWH